MSRDQKSNAGCFFGGITLLIILTLVAGGIWFINKDYKSKQEAIAEAVSKLPEFDEVATGKEIAASIKSQYPVPNPTMTEPDIAKKTDNEAKSLTKKKYPVSSFTKNQSAIFKKYRQAKPGEEVSFLLNTTGKTVKGVYKGTFKDHKGRFIKIDFHEHRLPDVLEDFHYLFVDGLATQKATEKKKELESTFKNNKSSFFREQKKLLTEKYYKESGYTKEDDVWIPNIDIFNAKLRDQTTSFNEQLEKDANKIYERNKVIGLFRVSLPEKDDLQEKGE